MKVSEAKNLGQLARALDQLNKDLPNVARKARNSLASTLLRDLIYITPVDTSWALSNWQVTPLPLADEIPPYVKGKGGSTRNVSAAKAYAAGLSNMRSIKAGNSVYIVNYAHHIDLLNSKGQSPQQAAGFVGRMVAPLSANADVILAQEMAKSGY